MVLNPSILLFLMSIFASVFVVMSSSSMLISWVGVEFNALTFIPLILLNKHSREAEASIKYFLTQTLGSLFFLLGALYVLKANSSLLISVGMLIKMGVAPFHGWVPSVASSMNWSSLFFMLTIQKINPLILFSMNWTAENLSNFTVIFIVSSLIFGSVVGLSQANLRKILVYSSISHLGWILSAIKSSLMLAVTYFLIYCLLLLPITLLCQKNNLSHLPQLTSMPNTTQILPIFFLSMLSMGGLPPFLGFFPKWLVIQHVVEWGPFLTIIMVLTSLLTLFFYLRVTFTSFTLTSMKFNPIFNELSSNWMLLSLLLSLSGLFFVFF
nr:NADH dehydrogenase subunit 2 [Sida crystallina]